MPGMLMLGFCPGVSLPTSRRTQRVHGIQGLKPSIDALGTIPPLFEGPIGCSADNTSNTSPERELDLLNCPECGSFPTLQTTY